VAFRKSFNVNFLLFSGSDTNGCPENALTANQTQTQTLAYVFAIAQLFSDQDEL